MSGAEPRPPTGSRRLLAWAARRLGTPEMVEDASELFARHARRDGLRAARRWYRRQARSSLVQLLLRRSRPRASRLAGISLDAKLAFRMLVRYPGLTLVGGLAMAFAIFVGAATFTFLDQMVDPTLPLPDGRRIVGIRYWDAAANERELPRADELRAWREELATVEDLGGFQTVSRHLAVGREVGEPVEVARISAAGFRVAAVPPLLGRTLVASDEEPGAPPVLVVGHRTWRARFGSDPAIVGRTVRLDDVETTVVGVMPEGFGFPRDHDLWTPLRLTDPATASTPGAPLYVFGRLAEGSTLAQARAEATASAAGAVRPFSEDRQRLTIEVLPYAESLSSVPMGPLLRLLLYQLNVYPALFLILVCGNIALLVFARAAARSREIVVRSALGAGRRRIVGQLFIEALALGGLAAALGLAATGPGLRWILEELRRIGGGFPFWVDGSPSATTMAYAGLLTVGGAAVAGVVPALKITGRDLRTGLSQAASGAGGPRLGGIWSAVIVAQVAATLVFTATAWVVGRQALRNASVEPHFPAERYVGVMIEPDLEAATLRSPGRDEDVSRRYAADVQELVRRIASDPDVAGVALADRLPVQARGFRRIEVDAGGAAPVDPDRPGHRARSDAVDPDFFDVLGARPIAGRGFGPGDPGDGSRVVVVNASFVEEVLGGRSAVGRRVRYLGTGLEEEPGPWHEIVGVVSDLVAGEMRAMSGFEDPPKARVYHPLDGSRAASYELLYLIVHAPGGPEAVGATLHETARAVGPGLRLHGIGTLDRVDDDIALLWRLFAMLVVFLSAVALVLALAGIYAVMSFTVARRTREIGVRVALGARAPRVVAEVFRRPLTQVGAGVLAGSAVVGLLVGRFAEAGLTARSGGSVLVLALAMTTVCMLACVGPTLRALRVEPAQALGEET